MEVIKTKIKDLVILKPKIFEDERGYFMESFKESFFEENFPHIKFIQDNESRSTQGVLRGMHFQKPPFEQTKLVRVVRGEVYDVAVDLRKDSKTFGQHHGIILSEKNNLQFLIPKGFAHGFLVLSSSAVFQYKVDNLYSKEHEISISYKDSTLNINWSSFGTIEFILSEKDRNCMSLMEYTKLINEIT